MKTKKTFTTLFFFIYIFCYSQGDKILVQYKSVRNNLENTESIIAEKNQALYVTDPLYIDNKENAKITKIDEENNRIEVSQKIINLDFTKYYLKQNSNILYYTRQFKNKESIVRDSLPTIKWDLSQTETKNIGGFICNKATANFRGSEIVAWYAVDIPISFGPWKFRGLPGLILELYNQEMTQIWRAEKVIYPYLKSTDFQVPAHLPMVTLREVVREMEEDIKEQIRRSNAKLPQGVRTTNSKINRTGIEKIYEWEN